MNKQTILKAVYELLEGVTPLRRDCGSLCDKACCDGGDEDKGMLLFPGEKELLSGNETWLDIVPAENIGTGLYLARCSGTCPRELRPLACRIFPLTPYLTQNDILQIKMDTRAMNVCPLAAQMNKSDLRQDFLAALRKASQLLITDSDIKEHINNLSRMIDDYDEFQGQWGKL